MAQWKVAKWSLWFFNRFMTCTSLILVPNNRLKRWLIDNPSAVHTHHANYQIHTFHSWLTDCWQRIDTNVAQTLLTPLEERILWQLASAASAQELGIDAEKIQGYGNIITQLSSVHQWCHDYCLAPEVVMHAAISQAQLFFAHAQQHYLQEKRRKKVISEHQLFATLLDYSMSHALLPQSIQLCNFLAIVPQVEQLLDICRNRFALSVNSITFNQQKNATQYYWDMSTQSANSNDTTNNSDNIEQLLQQAKAYITHHPTAQVAVVVHNLAHRRGYIASVCTALFYEQPHIYNISLAAPYVEQPSMACVLAWLEIALLNKVDSNSLCALLLDVHTSVLLNTATLVDKLRINAPHSHSWHSLLAWLNKHECIDHACLEELLGVRETLFHGSWTQGVYDLLTALKWQAPIAIQTYFATQLGYVEQQTNTKSVHVKYAHLRWLLSEQGYTPTDSKQAQIHILGTLESAALPFDRLFVCDAEQHVRIPTRFTPLLHKDIQEQYRLPYSQHWCLAQQTHLLSCWTQLNQSVVFAFQRADTPAYNTIMSYTQPYIQLPMHNEFLLMQEQILSTNTDMYFTPVITRHLQGGTQLFEDIQNCPLRAQLAHRFAFRALPYYAQHTDRMQGGKYIHALAEQLYASTSNQPWSYDLLQKELAVIAPMVQKQVYGSITPLVQATANRLHNALIHCLLQDTLSVTRSLTEQTFTLTLGDYRLSIRLDRIDFLDNNQLRIVDYKYRRDSTGMKRLRELNDAADISHVTASLPVQLMLYALIDTTQITTTQQAPTVAHVAYAHIHHSAQTAWQNAEVTALQTWRNYVMALLGRYTSGDYQALPSATTCRYCACRDICKLAV